MMQFASAGIRFLTLASLCLVGCTSVRVNPVSEADRMEHICIQKNPRVAVSDFVAVMQEGFQKHGVSSELVGEQVPAECHFFATYTARRNWDLAPYLIDAQIDIYRDRNPVASANYHLKGKGGLALNKWADTRSKILPVIDQLLGQVANGNPAIVKSLSPATPLIVSPSTDKHQESDLARRLSELKQAYEKGLINQQEYETKRGALIDSL